MFQSLSNANGQQGHGQPDNAGGPGSPFTFLSQMFNPANARGGDAVFSQEALDQVISQLMEQNQGSTAPGPAPADAIQSLPTKKVDKEMLGDDGKAECSICMDNVEIGDDVTVLPCGHWFHGFCVTSWLKEHDTCPHCRKGIAELARVNSQSQPPPQPSENVGRHHRDSRRRRASSVSSPRSPGVEGSRRNPLSLPESPSDVPAARRQYFNNPTRPDYSESRRGSSRVESSHERSSRGDDDHARPSMRREASGSSATNSGVSGWIRNHFPFQG